MAKSVLFVHGTGVRKAAYEYSAARIAQGLKKVAPETKLVPCLWGDVHGAKLGLGGVSIPEFSGTVAASASEDEVLALWELLARDPFFELRELAASVSKSLEPPAEKQRKVDLTTKVAQLRQDTGVQALVQERGVTELWGEAVSSVLNSPALKDALTAAAKVDGSLRMGVSRAVVAVLQQQLADEGFTALPVMARDELVELCVDRLGGRELGIVKDWIASRLAGLGLRWATARARRKRDALFSAAAPTAGDVVLYQARGAAIRTFIEQRIVECGPEVILLAHSLGGIACVDLLIERPLPQVKLLVTAGSQAPFLYEIGALCSLPFGKPLPPTFPAWVNFYDCNDLLSYRAAPVFTGRARDHELRSEQPFPQSHGAYWDDTLLWERIAPHLR